MTQNKLKDDLNIINHLTELACKNNLSEIEYNKTSSESSGLTIKIKRSIEQRMASSNVDNELTKVTENISKSREGKENRNSPSELTESADILKSPMVGTVYLSPDPQSDPFIKVGDIVNEGQPVLIIEAMKTMNHIPANRSGTVKNILVKNSSPVEFGDPLVLIE